MGKLSITLSFDKTNSMEHGDKVILNTHCWSIWKKACE